MGTELMGRWGTWEELLLGGAVLRHGTRDWNVVAAELRARTVCPYSFTPEVCKAKYEDLQERYSGSKAWYEELRKKRVEELKRALEISEDSIGSLQSKLESLKAAKNEKGDDCRVENGSGSPELRVPSQKLERVESSTKDGLSAGSFTHETRTNWSPECQVPAVSAEDVETKPEVSQSTEPDKVLYIDNLAHSLYEGLGKSFKKRRGKRKRKDCSKSIKEASVGESDLLDSADVVSWCKESSTSNCGEVAKSSGLDDHKRNLKKDGVEYMMEILDSVFETKGASAFRRRLDSQKRGRYKKMIRRHMDFDTIRSRISSQTIKSAVELFRDLLLLTNNALVFYSKSTREYKTALLLRDLVMKKLKESVKVIINNSSPKGTTTNVSSKVANTDSNSKVTTTYSSSKVANTNSNSKVTTTTTNSSSKVANANSNSKVATTTNSSSKVANHNRSSKVTTTNSSKVATMEDNEPIKVPVHNTHVKPRSVRPGNRKIVAKAVVGGDSNSASGVSQGAKKKPSKADSPFSVESLPAKKKPSKADSPLSVEPLLAKKQPSKADSQLSVESLPAKKKPGKADSPLSVEPLLAKKQPSKADSPLSVESLPAKKKPGKADSPLSVEPLPAKKKPFSRQKKVGRGNAGQKPATPMKGKKRVRTK